MAQPLRNTQARLPAYWETIRDRIEAGKAIKVVNQALNGDVLPAQQLNTAIFVINKMLPSLQAVAVEVTHKSAASKEDLEARALAAGIDPATLFSIPATRPSITLEKTDSPADSLEAPPPPDM
jgi:hypothetical protein